MPPHDVADLSLAGEGEARVAWAEGQMPVLRSIRERFAVERPLDGVRVAACLHVTAETANFVAALAEGGARVALWVCPGRIVSSLPTNAARLIVRAAYSGYRCRSPR